MKFKKLTAVIAVITVAALLAAGCGSKEEKAGDKPGKTIIATQDLLSTSAVSYTHLDVYKRQQVHFWDWIRDLQQQWD